MTVEPARYEPRVRCLWCGAGRGKREGERERERERIRSRGVIGEKVRIRVKLKNNVSPVMLVTGTNPSLGERLCWP